eukprot:PRCOL_00004075-RA
MGGSGGDWVEAPPSYAAAPLFDRVSFGWAWPVLARGRAFARAAAERAAGGAPKGGAVPTPIDVELARALMAPSDAAAVLTARLESSMYGAAAAQRSADGGASGGANGGADSRATARLRPRPSRGMARSLVHAFRWDVGLHCLWAALESAQRIGMSLLLRALLRALNDERASARERYSWAVAMSLCAFAYCLCHHQTFWMGMRCGMRWRVSAVGAIHAKALRLEAGAASEGTLTSLVSNDVSKFEEAGAFYPFVVFGPLEALVVGLLVGMEMGWAPAVAGMSVFALLVPLQYFVGTKVSRARSRTAARTDARVSSTAEALKGALALKMYGFERSVISRVSALRKDEEDSLRFVTSLRAISSAIFFVIDLVAIGAAILTFVARGGVLTIPGTFFVVSLMRLPKLWIGIFSIRGVETCAEALASCARIDAFMALPEAGGAEEPTRADVAAELRGCDFYHARVGDGVDSRMSPENVPSEASKGAESATGALEDNASAPLPALRGVHLTLRRGELIAVVGSVGAGKSSLLNALMGNMAPTASDGVVEAGVDHLPLLPRRLAYCAQEPWLAAGSVRDNVCFGATGRGCDAVVGGESKAPKDNTALYRLALESTALIHDLELLPHGDATLLGERGVNLSGGQKARLALARVVYSGLDTVLLDDPLAAVDSAVKRHLFVECICGALKGRTVVLATHSREYLPLCDRVCVLQAGKIAALGTHEEVVRELKQQNRPELLSLVLADGDSGDNGDLRASTSMNSLRAAITNSASAQELQRMATEAAAAEHDSMAAGVGTRQDGTRHAAGAEVASVGNVAVPAAATHRGAKPEEGNAVACASTDAEPAVSAKSADGGLVREISRVGKVESAVYVQVMRRVGFLFSGGVFAGIVMCQVLVLLSSFVLLEWSDASAERQGDVRYLRNYLILLGLLIVAAPARSLAAMHGLVSAASSIHASMLRSVIGARLSFFHTVPVGRVLNRFTKDAQAADELLPYCWLDTFVCFAINAQSVGLLAVALPLSLPAALFLLLVFLWLRRTFLQSSREVKRSEGVSRSPIYASFSATLAGLTTVRAFGAQERSHEAFIGALHENSAWLITFIGIQRWLGIRLDAICALLVSVASISAVASLDALGPGLVAIALESALLLSGALQWAVRQSAELQVHLTSVERMLDYCNLPADGAGQRGGCDGEGSGTGQLELVDLTARYRAGLPPVLRGVSLCVPGGTSLGIVGRTGSGKSSLLLALFKLIDVTGGAIRLDGTDSRDMALARWRSMLAIIPQDAIFFAASIRYNLDPRARFADADLWDALREAQMDQVVRERGGLDTPLEGGLGTALSAGQKQLLALARVLLSRAPVLALDEATANTDAETDAVIQNVLLASRTRRARTLLVVAHRLDTIAGADQVCVLGNGRLLETGAPHELATREGGAYRALLDAADSGH